MRRKLQAKLNSKKGFTLVELLIVVAIIAILVAVSIPLVNTSLNKARIATDQANERAARAAGVVDYLMNDEKTGEYFYDAENGKLVGTDTDSKNAITAYGKCSDHKDGIIKVTVTDDGEVTLAWESKGGQALAGIHGIDGTVPAAAGNG